MVKFIDIFGTTFQFTILKNDKYKTTIGGILSIISIIVILIFVYLFGLNFFYKLNPEIIQQDIIKDNYGIPINITNNNLIIAFRIEDDLHTLVNFEGEVFPFFEYRKSKKNNQSINTVHHNININYERCDFIKSNNSFYIQNINFSQWYCLDFKNSSVDIGGFWDADYVNYFYMRLDMTSNGIYNMEKLQNYISKGRYISFLLPYFYFDIKDQIQPLKQIYKNYFYKLNLGIGKYDRIYFKNITNFDDRGWLLNNIYYNEVLSTSQLLGDYYSININDIESNYLYRSVFYYDKDIIQISRNYMKLQDLGARVGGLINIIMLICNIILNPINLYKRNESLFNILFEYDEKSKNQRFLNTQEEKLFPSKEFKNIKGNNILNNIKIEMGNIKRKNFKFGYLMYFKIKYLSRYVGKNNAKYFKLYKFLTNYIVDRLDVSYFIKFIENMRLIKILLLENREQNIALNYIKNPNLANIYEIKKFDLEMERDNAKDGIEIINYYNKKINNKSLSRIDTELLYLIDNRITKYIKN